jgi:hypothetical protein
MYFGYIIKKKLKILADSGVVFRISPLKISREMEGTYRCEDSTNGAGKKLCDRKGCKWCYEKSFDSVEKWWGKPGSFMVGDDPRMIFKNSRDMHTFYCLECDHDFDCQPYSFDQSEWPCPYCEGDSLCGSETCKVCFDKSFASHHRAKYWSIEQNNIQPIDVMKSSVEKYWFDCPYCPEPFESSLANIARCPYCCPTRCEKLCGDETCKYCWNRSLASIVEKKNFVKGQKPLCEIPRRGRRKMYKFICDSGHEFEMLPTDANYWWCPICPKKSRTKVYNWLKEIYSDYTIKCQASFSWCESLQTDEPLYYDFYIKKLDIIIEVVGPRHFRQTSDWMPMGPTQDTDRYKEEKAIENDISIIRVLQTDILSDICMDYDIENDVELFWQDKIQEEIENLRAEKKRRPRVINIEVDNIFEDTRKITNVRRTKLDPFVEYERSKQNLLTYSSRDIIEKVILELNLKNFYRLSGTNRRIYEICRNEAFQERYFVKHSSEILKRLGKVVSMRRSTYSNIFFYVNWTKVAKEEWDPAVNKNRYIKCASMNGNAKIVKLLLKDLRVDPSVKKNKAIRYVSKHGKLAIVKLLLNNGRADPSAYHDYAIEKASDNGHFSVVKLLLRDWRINPTEPLRNALTSAVEKNRTKMVELLLQDSRTNPTYDDIRCISHARENGNIDIVELLEKWYRDSGLPAKHVDELFNPKN